MGRRGRARSGGGALGAARRFISVAQHSAALAAQWHATKNGALTPNLVPHASWRKVWWQCPRAPDHEWQQPPATRKPAAGCPFCKGKWLSVTNSLAGCRPDLAIEWHPTRNGALIPAQVHRGSPRKVWWQCPAGAEHEWVTSVIHRTVHGSGCPYCSGRHARATDSLATRQPTIAAQWHPTANAPLTPATVNAYTRRVAWWQCLEDTSHVWAEPIGHRTRKGHTCPKCAGRQPLPVAHRPLLRTGNLRARSPELAAQWHPTKNGELTPERVHFHSGVKVWWKCPAGPDHEWCVAVSSRYAGRRPTGCPFCVGSRVSVTNSVASRYPALARQWHPTRNEDLTPDRVTPGSGRKVWWRCENGHEWRAVVNSRVRGRGCPYCSGKKVSEANALSQRYPALAAQWHPRKNGRLTPRAVSYGSTRKVWWKCKNGPDHAWRDSPNHRSKRAATCPFCAGKRVSVTNSLQRLRPRVAAEWHPTRNGTSRPKNVVAASRQPAWWRCRLGHVWWAPIRERAISGRGCPLCAAGVWQSRGR